MTKPPYDLRDYLFDELTPAERAEVDRFLAGSAEARLELDRLRQIQQAMMQLPQEEIPRRIAFVSDKVFEPSPLRRFWRSVWEGGPRLAFGMAAMLAVFFGGVWATEPVVRTTAEGWELAFGPQPAPVSAPAESLSAEQVRAIVTEAVAQSEQRQQTVLARLAEPRPVSPAAPQVTRTDLEELRNDSDQAWRMLQTRIDELWKEASQLNLASLQR